MENVFFFLFFPQLEIKKISFIIQVFESFQNVPPPILCFLFFNPETQCLALANISQIYLKLELYIAIILIFFFFFFLFWDTKKYWKSMSYQAVAAVIFDLSGAFTSQCLISDAPVTSSGQIRQSAGLRVFLSIKLLMCSAMTFTDNRKLHKYGWFTVDVLIIILPLNHIFFFVCQTTHFKVFTS